MLMTTTPSVEGKRIVRYLGVVTGETIIGANDLDYETVGGSGSMLMVTCSGTAVRVE